MIAIGTQAWIQEFLPVGFEASLPENSSDVFLCIFFSPQLILQFYSGL